jgi:hypothetical protein
MKTITIDYDEYLRELNREFEKGVQSVDLTSLDDTIGVVKAVIEGGHAYSLAQNWITKHCEKKND